MDLTALRSDSGITKSTNRQGRRPGKSACTACHSRKKRCDAAPPHYQCTFCTKEDQLCIPRDPVERPARHRIPKRKSNTNANCKGNEQTEKETVLPPGIDHKIPRWSALYSFYSEMQRLLPPSPSPSPSPEPEQDNTHALCKSDIIEKEQGISLPETKSARHNIPQSSRSICTGEEFNGINISASQTMTESLSSRGQETSGKKLHTTEDLDNTVPRGDAEGCKNIGVSGDAFMSDAFMSDLDALLRF